MTLAPNPSHLEFVNPVVEGMARAAQDSAISPVRRRTTRPRRMADSAPRRRRLPRPGRGGRDAQSLRAAGLHHRRHDPHHRQQPDRLHHRCPSDSRSTLYASDLAKGFEIPIVHVNADDPEAA